MKKAWYDSRILSRLISPERLWEYARASFTKPARRWFRKGTWAVLDQGLFATSNFILNILLARWLSPDAYGAFGLTFAIFLLIGSIHSAMLTEPLLVFGPGKYKDRLPEYMGSLLYGHLSFAGLGSATLLLVSAGFALAGSNALAVAMLALALTGPFILLLWLTRRMCYTRSEPRLAASGGAVYMVLMVAGAWILYRQEWLSVATALGVMAISALSTSIWLMVRLRVKLPPLRQSQLVRDAFADHWSYGRWSVGNQGLNWIPMNIYYVIIPVWGGLAAGASFKALMNLVMPMLQAVWALSILLLPSLVRARDKGRDSLDASIRAALVPFVIGPTLYWLLLALFQQPLVSWLYDGKYEDYTVLLWLLGLSPIVASVKQVMGQSLRALERPDSLFFAYALSAVVALTLGTALVYLFGIVGAGISLVGCQAITAALAYWSYRRLRRLDGERASDA
jgi:O-antigen/teichoic acid export membrane protein